MGLKFNKLMQAICAGVIATTYLGQVATATMASESADTTSKYFNARTPHFNRGARSGLQIMLPTWYVSSTSPYTETNCGGVITYSASVEYPAGTFTQVKWGGSASYAHPDGSHPMSDVVSVNIPDGAQFWLNIWGSLDGTAVLPTCSQGGVTALDSANGAAFEYSTTSLPDRTMVGGTTSTGGAVTAFSAVLIVGQTSLPCLGLIGDSRTVGVNEAFNASGDRGETARSIGPAFGYIKLARAGSSALQFNNSSGHRLMLANYCSHFICDFDINGLTGGTSSGTITQIQAIQAKLPGKPFYQCTLSPVSASTDGWATTLNQTTSSSVNAQRVAFNDSVRAGIAGVTGYFEVADAVESARNSGLWKAPGYTIDGLHASATGSLAIVSANAISTSTFVPYAWGGGPYITNATVNDWVKRVATAGGAESTKAQTAAQVFVVAATANAYLSNLKRLNLMVGTAGVGYRIPLIATLGGTSDSVTGTVTASDAIGVSTDGSTGYMDSGYSIPSVSAGGLFAYLRTTQASDSTVRALLGERDGTAAFTSQIAANMDGNGQPLAGSVGATYNSTMTGARCSTTGGLVAGLWMVERSASNSQTLSLNGVDKSTDTTSSTPGGGASVSLFARNVNGTRGNFLAANSAVGAWGLTDGLMGATKRALFYADLQTFQTAMGRQV